MESKEIIIINGVDVSKCELVEGTHLLNIKCWAKRDDCGDYEGEFDKDGSCYCKNNPNCHYKQLQRKTAECEELKVRLKNSELIKNLEEKKQECKKLEKENSKLTSLFEESRRMMLKSEQCTYKLVEENNKLKDLLKRTTCQAECYKHKEAERYKQALDTVSEYIKDNCNSCQGIKYGGCDKCEIKQIKEIISKAKDGK